MRPDIKPGGKFPEWDLSKPGLRKAWDAGDYSPFHGWNKRPGQKPTALSRERK
jgi:hypothetical protein